MQRPISWRLRRAILASLALLASGMPLVFEARPALAATGHPSTPPARICGNAEILDGPATPPAGWIRIDLGHNLQTATQAYGPGTSFWLSPGVHTIGDDMFSQITPKSGNSYTGAPGAVLDGQGINRAAFTQRATGVSIRHLTIRNFNSPLNEAVVNHDSGENWTIERNTITNNGGAGVMLGTNTSVHANCLADNGQYGFSAYTPGGGHNVVLDRNEIARNNTSDVETTHPGCGCAGAGKFWNTSGAVVTNNWVHDNRGPGLWADTNNIGFRIEGNYIEGNHDEGIFYEISYNARIANNTLKRNAIVKGLTFAAQGQNMPVAAIYISESGGDERVNSGVFSTMEITGNFLEDNWGGVSLWENSDRFCGSPANTSDGFCTVGGSGTLEECVPGSINDDPYLSDCRWKTQNVSVHHNEFRFSRSNVGCTTSYCGQQALLANFGTFPDWSPYQARVVQQAITATQNNRFFDNLYVGDWLFTPYESRPQPFSEWQSTYRLDVGSEFTPSPAETASSTTPAPSSPPSANLLDADSSGAEGSVGQWAGWFSADVSSSIAHAHGGSRSLRVDVTAPHGWGVQQLNWPGFAATAGSKSIGFWGMTTSGSGLSATMRVHWRDESGAVLGTEVLTLALGGSWARAGADVVAPAGTTRVAVDFSHGSGVAGTAVFLDDVVVASASPAETASSTTPAPSSPPSANLLDADSSGAEGSVGQWAGWFSADVSSSIAHAQGGSRSLRVDVTAPHGWGVQQLNWPGFAATAGSKSIGFWGMTTSGSGLSATMRVHWRDESGAVLGTEVLTLALGGSWARAGADVVAPVGTTRVAVDFSHGSGVAGTAVFLDDVVVASASPPSAPSANLLDADSSGAEGSVGQWAGWFSADVSSSIAHAHGGSRSLRVDVTAPHGWGVQQLNWPGFAATAGSKSIGFWGMTTSGSGLSATMRVHWRDESGAVLGTEVLTLALGGSWARAGADVVAPAGATRVAVDFSHGSGVAGTAVFLDDVVVA